MTDPNVRRRRFLKYSGAALGLSSLSGCMMVKGSMGTNMKKMAQVEGGVKLKGNVVEGAPATGNYPAAKSGEQLDVLLIAFQDDTNNYHFLPHVAWIEPGATVRWKHTAAGISERRTHSTTAISSNLMPGYPRLIPKDVEGWDSGFLPGVGPFKFEAITGKSGEGPGRIEKGPFTHTFDKQGVYIYLCQNHFGFGMAGAIVVGELWKENRGDGWSPAMTNSGIKEQIMQAEEDPSFARTISMKINKALRPFVWNGKKSKKMPASPPWK